MDAFSWFKTSYLISCINHKAITPGSKNRWCVPKFINEKVFITSWLIKPCFYSNLTMYQSIVYSSSILKWYFLKCIIFWQNTSWYTPLRLCITNIPITDQSCLNTLRLFFRKSLWKLAQMQYTTQLESNIRMDQYSRLFVSIVLVLLFNNLIEKQYIGRKSE